MQKMYGESQKKRIFFETANAGIDATEEFLKSLGIPMTLSEGRDCRRTFYRNGRTCSDLWRTVRGICSAESRRCCEYLWNVYVKNFEEGGNDNGDITVKRGILLDWNCR